MVVVVEVGQSERWGKETPTGWWNDRIIIDNEEIVTIFSIIVTLEGKLFSNF